MKVGWYRFGGRIGFANTTLNGTAMSIDYVDGGFTVVPLDHWQVTEAKPVSADDVAAAKANVGKRRSSTR